MNRLGPLLPPYYLESRSGSLQGCPKHSGKLASAGSLKPDA